MLEESFCTGINMANIINNVQSKKFDMQQKNYEIPLSKDLSNEQFNALDKVLQDDLNISDKVDYDIFDESQNLPLVLKCIEQKQFQQGKEKFDTDCNTNITTNRKWEIYNKLQKAHSANSQKITEEENVNKDMPEKFEHIARTSAVTQQNIEGNDPTLSKKNVKSIKSLHEQLEQNKDKLKTTKSTEQEMTTNVKTIDIKKINSLNKINLIAENELMRQNANLRFIAANEQNELKKLYAQLQMYYDRCNMSDEKEITTDFVMQKTNMMHKILELENEILKFENQEYMEKIKKFSRNEENIHVKHPEHHDENNKDQKAKHDKYESDVQIKLMNRILTLYTEIEWWKQRFERNQAALITMTTEKQKAETELMKFVTKVTELQNMRDTFEKEKLNLLLQTKNKNEKASGTESFNALTSQKNILHKEKQQISSEINSVSSNMQNILKDQVPEIIAKDADIYYITLPSAMWRQVIMKEGDYNYITLPITKIVDKTVKSRKQVNKDFNKDLEKLLKMLNKLNEKLNKISVKIVKLLKKQKTNDKSIFVEEQVPTLIEDFNKDCMTLQTIIRQIEKEDDHDIPLLSIKNIADKESDKAVESPEQVDKGTNKNAVIESLTDFQNKLNKILDKDFVKIMELLEDLKVNDKSTIIEKQVPALTKDFNEDCITLPSIMRQIEKEDDHDISLSSIKNIADKESDKAESPEQVDKESKEDTLIESLTDFRDKLNKNFVKIMELLEYLKMNNKSTIIEKHVPALTKDFNEDCITLPSIIRQIEKEDDHDISPSSIKNIANKESDKAESSEEVDKEFNKDALIEMLTHFQDKLNKNFVKIMELLEYLKMNDESTIIEKQVPTLTKDFNEDCITLPSIMRQIEKEDDHDISLSSIKNIANKESDKAESSEEVDKELNKDALIETLTHFQDKLNKNFVKIMELLEYLKMNDESTIIEKQVPTLTKDFNEDCITLPSIMQQIEKEDDHDISLSSIKNIVNKESDKAESPEQVDKEFNKNPLIETLTHFQDKLNKNFVKIKELLEDPKTNDKSTTVEKQIPILYKNFNCMTSSSIIRKMDKYNYDCNFMTPPSIWCYSPPSNIDEELDIADESLNFRSLSVMRQIEDEIYDYDYASPPLLSSPNNFDTEDESSSITSLSIMRQMEEENHDYDYIAPPPMSPRIIDNEELDKAVESPKQVDKNSKKDVLTEPPIDFEDFIMNQILNEDAVKIMELLKNLKTNYKSTFVEEQVPTLTKDFNRDCIILPSIIRQIEEENYNYDYITPPNIADKELNKAVELSKQVDTNSIEDTLTEPLTDFEDTTNKVLNKEIIKVTELLEDLKTNDKSIIIEQEEEIQKKDKVADGKERAKKDDNIFEMKNLILSLPFYELPRSIITKDQSIVTNMDSVSQSQLFNDYQSFENCSLCKKFNDHAFQQREKNLGPNEVDANINKNHTRCKYCNLAIDILMKKYNNKIDHVNNEFQTIENNKNREHGYVSSEAVEEDQIIKAAEENKIEEVKNTDSNTVSNETLPYAKDVIFEDNIKALAKEILIIENTSNVAFKIDYKLNKRIAHQNNNWTLTML